MHQRGAVQQFDGDRRADRHLAQFGGERQVLARVVPLDVEPVRIVEHLRVAVGAGEQRALQVRALARDGVSCATCHHISIDENEPFGHTFTGDFRVGAPDVIHGPFAGPQQVPMDPVLRTIWMRVLPSS